eukprot:gnl/Spiro4/5849_TR2984_c0_g8_i1.p1 gnl/Spiro4/5849_TR2984_c0_g8~~gnl/Spiro4/5849_TR2984_c0_g8_i1.p1  ORF type:complete len:1029 (+),score=350.57 gnl/Spiro4/5849_TR2984_c0_g8_i1:66-3152(+)
MSKETAAWKRGLINYFAVVSAGSTLEPSEITSPLGTDTGFNVKFSAHIVDRYPLADSPEFPIPKDLPAYAFPGGLSAKRQDYPPPSKCFTFAIPTRERVVYGSCLMVWEVTSQLRVRNPLNNARKRQLANLSASDQYEQVRASGLTCDLDHYYDYNIPPTAYNLRAHEDTDGVFTIQLNKAVYLPRALVVLSHMPVWTVLLETVRELYAVGTTTNAPIPVESYLVHLTSEVAFPPVMYPVKFVLNNRVLVCLNAPPTQLPLADVSFATLFACLGIDKVLVVYQCLLLERSVLVLSSHYSRLNTIVQALLALLLPFRWQYVVVPVVPVRYMDVVRADVPFVVGCVRELLDPTMLNRQVLMVDVDSAELSNVGPLPPMPRFETNKLVQSLNVLVPAELHKADEAGRAGGDPDLPFGAPSTALVVAHNSAARTSLSGLGAGGAGGAGGSGGAGAGTLSSAGAPAHGDPSAVVWCPRVEPGIPALAVRGAFFRFVMSLFRQYRRFVIKPSAPDEPPPVLNFKKEEFLSIHPPSSSAFLSQVLDTKMFGSFVAARLAPSGSRETRLFDLAVDSPPNSVRVWDEQSVSKHAFVCNQPNVVHKHLGSTRAGADNNNNKPARAALQHADVHTPPFESRVPFPVINPELLPAARPMPVFDIPPDFADLPGDAAPRPMTVQDVNDICAFRIWKTPYEYLRGFKSWCKGLARGGAMHLAAATSAPAAFGTGDGTAVPPPSVKTHFTSYVKAVLLVQRTWRTVLHARRRRVQMAEAAQRDRVMILENMCRTVQRNWRMMLVRNAFRRLRAAAVCLQRWWRARCDREKYKFMLRTITGIQALVRRHISAARMYQLATHSHAHAVRHCVNLWAELHIPLLHRSLFYLKHHTTTFANMKAFHVEVGELALKTSRMFHVDGSSRPTTQQREAEAELKHMKKLLLEEKKNYYRTLDRVLTDEERELLFRNWTVDCGGKARKQRLVTAWWRPDLPERWLDSALLIVGLAELGTQGVRLALDDLLNHLRFHGPRVAKSVRWTSSSVR